MASISIDDVVMAAGRLEGYAVRTPLLESALLNQKVGGRVLIKPELFQRTGSFKFRGAFNRLSALNAEERERGVVAWSSGNHAQGIAAAAELLNMSATIIMPKDAPLVKVEKTERYGAQIVFYDRARESREQIGRSLAQSQGATLVPSYDDPLIMAGQGTCGLEIVQDCVQREIHLDKLLVCTGGGGLIAGSSIAVAYFSPDTKVYSVEPEQFDDHRRSLISGRREHISQNASSICDALLAPTPGELTFPINRELLTGGLAVSDDEVRSAIRFAYSELKLVIEPGGAVALAAVLSGKTSVADQTVCVVLSGGNVDPDMFSDILSL